MQHSTSVEVIEPGTTLSDQVAGEVRGLFENYYHRYHYLSKLGDAKRYRLLARDKGGTIVGYGSVEPVGAFALLSNLLVSSAAQGRGIGSLLESARMRLAADLALQPYSSCVTVGTQSQALKLKHGLRPLNYKLGYRRNVFHANEVSSSVVYGGLNRLENPVSEFKVTESSENLRLRISLPTQSYTTAAIETIANDSLCYVEILAHPAVFLPDSFVLQGIEIDLGSGEWGRLWQYKNAVRLKGERGVLNLIQPLSEIYSSANGITRELCRVS